MSQGNPENFPWGPNTPSKWQRMLFAAPVAVVCMLMLYLGRVASGGRTDFSAMWFATRSALYGHSPYLLIGPGRAFESDYGFFYPGTMLAALTPFALLPPNIAVVSFVGISVFLLALGATRDGWHRLPMFFSAAFFDSFFGGQWSILLTAAVFIPALAFFTCVKPQSGLPVVAAHRRTAAWVWGFAGTVVLLTTSLVMLPHWPAEWLASLRSATGVIRPVILSPLGIVVIPLVTRLRRWETWLILVSACAPQTLMWYSALMLLAIAATYREAVSLSLVSTLGFFAAAAIATLEPPHAGRLILSVFVASTYLPAVIVVIRRSGGGEEPAWLRLLNVTQHE